MFKLFKKKKYPTFLLVAAGLGSFVVIGIFILLLRLELNYRSMSALGPETDRSADKFYINTDYKEDDPYITKKPDLKDMLAGPIITEFDPSLGDKYAPVVIVYFSDFECDFCRAQEQALKKILEKYKYKTKLIWKDYPDSDINSVSFQAALAARCAAEQDGFWQYHDFLFELNDKLNRETFNKIADLIGIDKVKLDECLDATRPKERIYDNIEEANALDINGIPFMFVNDQEIMGKIGYNDLEKIVLAELEKAEKKQP